MTRFVLDTDIVSLLQRGNQRVAAHVGRHSPDEVATTIITVEEQLYGVVHVVEARQDGDGTRPDLRTDERNGPISEPAAHPDIYGKGG